MQADWTPGWSMVEGLATSVAVIVALAIAIFQDRLRSWLKRPKLDVSIKLEPPDCHRTFARYRFERPDQYKPPTTTTLYPAVNVGDTSFSGGIGASAIFPSSTIPSSSSSSSARWQSEVLDVPTYYLRLRVVNNGNDKAESVELFAAELSRQKADGTFDRVNSFLPMNLVWSHYGGVFLSAISPDTYKHCDLGHIVDPKMRDRVPIEKKPWTDDEVAHDDAILSLNTAVLPHTKSYLIRPGVYRLVVILAAANAKPFRKTLEINLTGDWYDDEEKMLAEGIGIMVL